MKRFVLLAVLAALTVVGLFFVPSQAIAGGDMKVWTLTIDATINPAKSDTSNVVNTSGFPDLFVYVSYDGDSATSTVQGSDDGSTWFNLSSVILNGVDETNNLQYYGPLVKTGISLAAAGTLTEFTLPPMNYTRLILHNHDAAGSDTLESVVAKFKAHR